MDSKRIDELQNRTAYPESMSVRQALLQVWNEMQQDFNKRTCENCKYYTDDTISTFQMCDLDVVDDDGALSPHFGCNKFEAKD